MYLFSQVRLRTEVLRTPSVTPPGFELMTSRLWQYISCHWDTSSDHSAISDLKRNVLPHYLRGLRWFQMHWCTGNWFFFKDSLGLRYHMHSKFDRTRGSNSWISDHDRTFHVTEMPAVTTQPSVTYIVRLRTLGFNLSFVCAYHLLTSNDYFSVIF